jgi:ribosomal RNA-processing protein 12
VQNEIFKASAEILLCLKDSNAKTRDAALALLISMASRGSITDFLKVIAAALGAQTPHMRSAATMALSRLVFEFAWNNAEFQAQLPSLLRTVLVLSSENSREIIKSVVGFIRISVAAIPSNQLEPLLPELIGCLMSYQKVKDRFRAKIKIILKKLVKLFGYDKLIPFVPESESRLLTHMRKLDERQKRRKEALKIERPNTTFDSMLDSDEEDSDDGRTLATGATSMFTRKGETTRTALSLADKSVRSSISKSQAGGTISTKSKRRVDSALRLPKETEGEVVDMLGSEITRRIKFAEDQVDYSDSDEMEFNDDGRLLVRDDLEASVLQSTAASDSGPHKKPRLQTENHQNDRLDRSKKPRELGASYKSKKAGGDVRKKGQAFEPYAYVPLDGRSYSKKNRRSAVEQMSSVVRKGGKRKR